MITTASPCPHTTPLIAESQIGRDRLELPWRVRRIPFLATTRFVILMSHRPATPQDDEVSTVMAGGRPVRRSPGWSSAEAAAALDPAPGQDGRLGSVEYEPVSAALLGDGHGSMRVVDQVAGATPWYGKSCADAG